MKVFAFLFFLMTFFGAASAYSQDWLESTDGNPEEQGQGFTKEEFEKMKNSNDPYIRDLYKKLVKGRLSSAKDPNSRYSGHLEQHDFDLDGITDHDDAGNDVEGGVEEAVLGKKGLGGEKRLNALEEARLKHKSSGCLMGATGDKAELSRTCKNISGAVVDLGSAHAGPDRADEDHRVYGLNPEIKKKMEAAGQKYFEAFQAEVLAKGSKDPNSRDMGNDAIRSEAVWLYKQWQFKMETAWKTLRAARLAGFRTDRPDEYGQREFLRDIGQMMADPNKRGSASIARAIAIREDVMDVMMCHTPPSAIWTPCPPATSGPKSPALVPPNEKKLRYVLRDTPDSTKKEPTIDPGKRKKMYELATQAAEKDSKNNKELNQKIARIEKCMEPEVWCYTPLNTLPKGAQVYSEVKGDPGEVFWDTREPLLIKMSEASKRPLAEQQRYVKGSIDFDSKMSGGRDNPAYKEWVDYISGVEKSVAEILTKAREARLRIQKNGGQASDAIEKALDPTNHTILQIFGRNEINDTFSLGTGPAPAASTGGARPGTLPGVDFKK
jgi:hypothetical protein